MTDQSPDSGTVTLFLCGDVMTGRGIDQILPHPVDPELREGWIRDARDYVALAEGVNGHIPRHAGFEWPWGAALALVDRLAPAVRVINLETAVTRSDRFAPGKRIHYRMSPENLPCLTAVRPDVAVLANNHILDFGPSGLADTLATLSAADIATAGAGMNRYQARSPVAVTLPNGARVIVLAVGALSSGVPPDWGAGDTRPGLDVVTSLNADAVADLTDRLRAVRRPGDLAIVSMHWGSNWGYSISPDQTTFAHRLIDAGTDIVYGHSSHHPRPIEIYHDRLILYGCGDLLNDYEGIAGEEGFRPDLRALYFPVLRSTGELDSLSVSVMRSRRLRLELADREDAVWLADVLEWSSQRFGTRVRLDSGEESTLRVGWSDSAA